ncbi:MAG: hypothetical protein O3B31_09445 [Chloroflexi bacterium]|nr:hypothetical protein [Chloroflexota bacterium]MDA1003552.1 hypothetical protein [Chloroflexota bacterium]
MADPLAPLRETGQLLMAEAGRLRTQLEHGRTIAARIESAWIGPAETAFVSELPGREQSLIAVLDAIERLAAELTAEADVAVTSD